MDGTLQVTGEKYDSTRVIFRSDRLDDPYQRLSWCMAQAFTSAAKARDNYLQYTGVKNAYQGIIAVGPSTNSLPKLRL